MRANICIYIRTGPLQSGGGFIVDVEAAGADAWPKCGNQIRCVRAAMQHGLDSVLGNIGCGATPAGMYCGNTATLRIGNQNGQAVRCAHGDGGLRRISQQYVRCYRVIAAGALAPQRCRLVCLYGLMRFGATGLPRKVFELMGGKGVIWREVLGLFCAA